MGERNQLESQISRAREYYTEVKVDGTPTKQFKCKICKKDRSGKCASNLVNHLRGMHKEIYDEEIANRAEESIHVKRLKTVYSCVELVTINSNPFSLLSSSGFRHALEDKLREFQLAGCSLNLSDQNVYEIKAKIHKTASEIREKIASDAKNKVIALMVDSATRNNRAIFGINIQYRHNGKLHLATIAMYELKKSHTAKYLGDVVIEVLKKCGLSLEQVLTFTTDNGSNMVAMAKDLEKRLFEQNAGMQENELIDVPSNSASSRTDGIDHNCDGIEIDIDEDIEQLLNETDQNEAALDILLQDSMSYEQLLDKVLSDLRGKSGNKNVFSSSIRCAAHTLQLAVWNSLGQLKRCDKNMIDLCRHTAKFLRLQTTQNKMREEGFSSIFPALDCKTRWSSTYIMVSVMSVKNIKIA